MPKSLKSQGFSEEEIIARKREQNRIAKAKNRAKGNEKTFRVTLTREDSEKLENYLIAHSLTFTQFIRKMLDGKITISFPFEKENTK